MDSLCHFVHPVELLLGLAVSLPRPVGDQVVLLHVGAALALFQLLLGVGGVALGVAVGCLPSI